MKPLLLNPLLRTAIAFSWVLATFPVSGQIVPDATLPSHSTVTPDGNTLVINGGTQAQRNLFHSFERFDVPSGAEAFFNNPLTIENILTRVTGGSVSQINGLIRASGSANLFLLNPNGIIFGPNAKLNIGGSFLATTADGLLFDNGFVFSASHPHASPLLTISVPIGLQYGTRVGTIANQSQTRNSFGFPVGLQVQPGRTLALVGGEINLEGGKLTASSGRIELGSVAANSTVNITPSSLGLVLDYGNVRNFQDIHLTQAAAVNANGSGGGEIQVQGRQITLHDGSVIAANTLGSESGMTLLIRASELLELIGTSGHTQLPTGVFASVARGATGQGGNLTVETQRLHLADGAVISSGTLGAGNSGDLSVRATEIKATGNAGPQKFPSGLFTTVYPGATGQGGNLTVETQRLYLADGAVIGAGTSAAGNSGDLSVRATEIKATGNAGPEQFPSGLFTTVNPGATGQGGNLTVETQRLYLADGAAIGAGTLGAGNSGDLIVAAERLGVRDGAQISVSSLGTGDSGNLIVAADAIRLDNSGSLKAETQGGSQGNITLNASDIQLRRNSNITTNAAGKATGGHLTIDTNTLVALENSDITANAQNAFGGQVKIAAQGIFGTQFRDQLTRESDITASSRLGAQFSGVVELQTPKVDPSLGLVELSEDFADPSKLIVTGCAKDSGSKFVIRGRDGLLESPTATLIGETVLADLGSQLHAHSEFRATLPATRMLNADGQTDADAVQPTTDSGQIVEAQGWVIDTKGYVRLVAIAPQVILPPAAQRIPSCSEF